jgi:hypothetical protein
MFAELELPEGWRSDTRLFELLEDAIIEAECGWLQCSSGLGFALACMIQKNERVDYRTAIAGKICEMVMTVAMTGKVPGGRLQ